MITKEGRPGIDGARRSGSSSSAHNIGPIGWPITPLLFVLRDEEQE
jgi:hypothetical protein